MIDNRTSMQKINDHFEKMLPCNLTVRRRYEYWKRTETRNRS